MGQTDNTQDQSALAKTPLHALHLELGGKMVPFAGYDMPVQYQAGIMAEHLHTRKSAGLFDVSHMGQAYLTAGDHDQAAGLIESLTPGGIRTLGPGRVRYTVLLNDDGGIIDDLMVTRSVAEDEDGRLYLVVNAARKAVDFARIEQALPQGVTLEKAESRALLALQGPRAAEILSGHCRGAGELAFMAAKLTSFNGIDCHISRSGYTGEDGYEISVAGDGAEQIARALLAHDEVEAIGLGARDSLRLEAGLCLYGHDIDETTSPIEAGLNWVIPKRRREEANFPGAKRILRELADGPSRLRVGIRPAGRAPAREGTAIRSKSGDEIGHVTSGGFGPSADGPVAMGYVAPDHAATGTAVDLMIRGKAHDAEICDMPFVEHNYHRPK
jgi:aminomethyltransferase